VTRRPALIVGAAIVVVAIAAIAVFATRRDEPHAAPGSASSSPPSELLDEIGELKGFVESKRGLPFKEEVSVKLLADDEFREHLKEDSREEIERKEAEEFEAILRALKLMQGDVNLSEKADELAAESVLGFYDPETKDLVVRGERPTPFLRQVLVHELTHALQDQHFNLQRPDLEQRDDETILTFDAVVEGDASRIEAAYFSSFRRNNAGRPSWRRSRREDCHRKTFRIRCSGCLRFPTSSVLCSSTDCCKAGGSRGSTTPSGPPRPPASR
jgi:hypothetical protein